MADTSLETRQARMKASGSSFYAGMRLLPKPEREAMFAIYGFAHAVDDIADEGNDSRGQRHAALDAWREEVRALYSGAPSPRGAFLADPIRRYGLREADFLGLIDGMEMDVADDIRAPDLATLDLYCDRAASTVGRLSVKVFGMDEAPGLALAHYLGRALQLTNILRDIDKDAEAGRLYLPREYLEEAGIASADPAGVIAHPAIDKACRKLAVLAHEHYRAADAVMRARPGGPGDRPRGHLRAPRLMGAVYSQILTRMEAAGWAPPRRRVRLGRGRMLVILATEILRR